MITVERMICTECAPRKLIKAQMKFYSRAPGKDDVAECSFCHRIRYCKCWRFQIGGKA